jgi:hypothetical protein
LVSVTFPVKCTSVHRFDRSPVSRLEFVMEAQAVGES